MQSKATSVAEYLASLPADRRTAISAVRKVILANLDRDYTEIMQYGMIGYAVPHSVFPAGYHCAPDQPLPFAALASQKNYMSVYMMGLYLRGEDGPDATWFRDAWVRAGRKLDMGKACVRFKKLEDVPLDVIGAAIRRIPAKKYIAMYEANLASRGSGAAGTSAARKSATEKKVSAKSSANVKARSASNSGGKSAAPRAVAKKTRSGR